MTIKICLHRNCCVERVKNTANPGNFGLLEYDQEDFFTYGYYQSSTMYGMDL